MGFFRATVTGGIVFLVPLVVLWIVIAKAWDAATVLTRPLSRVLPAQSIAGVALLDLLAVALLVAACFVAGLLARTAAAERAVARLESRVLFRIPGYTFIKGLTGARDEGSAGDQIRPALVSFDDYAQVGFEVERVAGEHPGDDGVVVFLPGAPNPWSGTVCIVDAGRVRPLAASTFAAARNISHLGRGTGDLLRSSTPPGGSPSRDGPDEISA